LKLIKFNLKYFGFAVFLFLIETYIALFVNDAIIRPYVGDVLVVILIYCFVKSVLDVQVLPTVIGVLAFSFLIEFLQYLNFVDTLGLSKNRLANTVLGNSFAWEDVLCYFIGAILIIILEKVFRAKIQK